MFGLGVATAPDCRIHNNGLGNWPDFRYDPGAFQDRESVRSSLIALIVSDTLPDNADQRTAGAAALLVDVRRHWQIPLTHDLLSKWQSMAVPERRYTPVLRGTYRSDPSPMQIVIGPYGREKVHYKARLAGNGLRAWPKRHDATDRQHANAEHEHMTLKEH